MYERAYYGICNILHYAVTYNTVAEIIYNRAYSEKEHIGLTSWKHSQNGKILENGQKVSK